MSRNNFSNYKNKSDKKKKIYKQITHKISSIEIRERKSAFRVRVHFQAWIKDIITLLKSRVDKLNVNIFQIWILWR